MKQKRSGCLPRFFKWMGGLVAFLILFPLFMVVLYRFVPVYYTPLMLIRLQQQHQAGKTHKLEHRWVPLEQISQEVPLAVVSSEDNLFMEHNGFDRQQIKLAIEEAQKGRRQRGASTITQQTAKNVFLWPAHSWVRKGLEAYLTLLIETVWSKERIMEVYLNSIEMGDGIYGVEAVAQAHFKKSAARLTRSEAALIAATLPNPLRYNSARPSPYVQKRQRQIMELMPKVANPKMGCGQR